MYSTHIYIVFVLITTSWAGILPKSRRPVSHGYRNGFYLGQIELRDPSIELDNFALRKTEMPDDHFNKDFELFGEHGIIYLTSPRTKNRLLKKIAEEMEAQYLRLRVPDEQEYRSVEVESPVYRRAEYKPKLVYEFNELVA